MTNSRDQLFERKWQPTKGRANHKKDIRKSKSKPFKKIRKITSKLQKKHEKKYEQTMKTTPVKAQANHKHQKKKHERTIKETRAFIYSAAEKEQSLCCLAKSIQPLDMLIVREKCGSMTRRGSGTDGLKPENFPLSELGKWIRCETVLLVTTRKASQEGVDHCHAQMSPVLLRLCRLEATRIRVETRQMCGRSKGTIKGMSMKMLCYRG